MSEEVIIKEYRYGLSRRTTFWMMVFMAVGTPAMIWFAFFLPPAEYESEDGGGLFILRAVACIAPMTPGSTPSTPASPQGGASEGGGAAGSTQR